jgi:hypothetical protein
VNAQKKPSEVLGRENPAPKNVTGNTNKFELSLASNIEETIKQKKEPYRA